MRVLQLIDSLRPGGAEKMSVSYANALAKRIEASFLCCTRMEGLLKKQLNSEVGYLFLDKKSTVDFNAFQRLRRFVKESKVDLIQAHSSSWFLALMVKLSLPRLKLVWHDHYGRELGKRKSGLIKPASKLFDGIISVNKNLETWSKQSLYCKEVRYIRNFLPESSDSGEKGELRGGDSLKIICVANFRPQKDHLNLLQAFFLILEKYPETSLHLIGKDEMISYSSEIKQYIERNDLPEKVFIYGEQENISGFLEQADLGILSSVSEGLPVALLEYGRAGLSVICTDVGECAEVIGSKGELVPPSNPSLLAEAIKVYLGDDGRRRKDGTSLRRKITTVFSEEAVIPYLLNFYCEVLDEQREE